APAHTADRAVQRQERDEQPDRVARGREQRSHPDARHQIGEHRGADDEQQGLEPTAHTPPGTATVAPLRAAAYACSTTPATRPISSRNRVPASPASSAATNASNRQANHRSY